MFYLYYEASRSDYNPWLYVCGYFNENIPVKAGMNEKKESHTHTHTHRQEDEGVVAGPQNADLGDKATASNL